MDKLKPIAVRSFKDVYKFIFETQTDLLNCEQVAAGYNGMIIDLTTRAAEADALRAEREQWGKDFSALMDKIAHLDDVLNDTDECEAWSGCADLVEQFDPWESIRVMVETAKALRATVAAQAQRIEAARNIISDLSSGISNRGLDAADAWLAANAPTQGKTEGEA